LNNLIIEAEKIIEKMNKLVDTSNVEFKEVVERYLLLSINKLKEIVEITKHENIMIERWKVYNKFESKFGDFCTQCEPIRVG
jgi:hypothetical protein